MQVGLRRAVTILCHVSAGPLLKLRGAMQNKKRWFILTSKRLVYFREVSTSRVPFPLSHVHPNPPPPS